MNRAYWMESKTELLKMARMKQYSISTVAFPLMFYCFFGLAMAPYSQGAVPISKYLLATYGAFGVMGATLYAFGVGVAVERGLGWLEVKRASPMPPAAYFLAKGVVSLTFGALVVTLLFALGAIFGGVRMPAGQWLLMWGALVAGAIPFGAIGLARKLCRAQLRGGRCEHHLPADGLLRRPVDAHRDSAEGAAASGSLAAVVPFRSDRPGDSACADRKSVV